MCQRCGGSLLAFLLLLFLPPCLSSAGEPADGAVYEVASAAELAERCQTVKPGDTVIIRNGTYAGQVFRFTGTGTRDKPITLLAQTPGKVILTGSSRLIIDGRWLVADGLHFIGGALKSGSIVDFAENDGGASAAQHCTLRNTVIKDYNPRDPSIRYFWVTLNGYGHVVEYCMFSGQNHSGVTLCVRLENGKPAGHVIRRNYFAGRPKGKGNGFETIRIGTGAKMSTNARCLVTENLFERCDGEIEIISNKSCENVYSRNTFLDCQGTLTLRQGHRCIVEENVFIARKARDSGGIRVTGRDHRITGNYFSGITGLGGAVISLKTGVRGNARGKYAQVKNCIIENNTMVDNPAAIFLFGTGHEPEKGLYQPEAVSISNTLIVATTANPPKIVRGDIPGTVTWKNNVLVTKATVENLPRGVRREAVVPEAWSNRLAPKIWTPAEVGPRPSTGREQ